VVVPPEELEGHSVTINKKQISLKDKSITFMKLPATIIFSKEAGVAHE